ncbi:Maebl [hydrothermal vent metagenome]|uniref:Maebl n=1 Tax=hydrothermal vent metagenome TaxID=652676 RepID=A0A1W1D2D2_9ZZZZ
MNNKQNRLAVLIDADNAQPSVIEGLLGEIASHGVASVKRIYGDWTTNQLSGWKSVLLEHGIQPIQQFSYTKGKNSTDSAMIIDAMDLLYTKNFDGFCIVTSDSDFTRLAARIREDGLFVFGFGEKKTPQAFMSACDKFVYTENLRVETNEDIPPKRIKLKDINKDKKVLRMMQGVVEDVADLSGWSYLATVGNIIGNKLPDFDPRNYGYRQLTELMRSTNLFEFKDDEITKQKSMFVRLKRDKKIRK